MAPVRHDAAPAPVSSPKKSHAPTTNNGTSSRLSHGFLHRFAMVILLPLLTIWDSLVFFFDGVFATVLYWLGLQVRSVARVGRFKLASALEEVQSLLRALKKKT